MIYSRANIITVLLITFSFLLFSEDDIERNGKTIKIRSNGICYLDFGITDEQAKIIAKYDAIYEALFKLGIYIEKNDSLITEKIGKNNVIKYFSNSLNTFVYKEGEENIDGYPAYVSYVTCEIHLDFLNRFLHESKINNQFRYQLLSEYYRLNDLFNKIGSLKETTEKIPENFIKDLSNKLIASDWANKAHLTDETGLKLEYYSISIDFDNLYEASYIYLADVMIKVGRNAEVLGMLNKLVNYDALKFPAAYTKRGEIYYLQKLYSVALKELDKAVAIDPKYSEAYCIMGSVYSALKKDDEALGKYKQAISLDENFYKPYYMRANFYRKNGKYDEALNDYNSAITLNPGNHESYFNRGIIFYLTGNYEKAIEDYSKAIYIDELSPVLYFNRAIAFRKLADQQKATDDYKTYLLLTVKDINKETYGELIKAWMADEKYKPIFQD
jgi:tetratricopeptide (TPR) repeat protein